MARKGAPPRRGRGFASKAQWKWAFANRMSWAHRVAHETKGGPKIRYRRLPARKKRPTARTGR